MSKSFNRDASKENMMPFVVPTVLSDELSAPVKENLGTEDITFIRKTLRLIDQDFTEYDDAAKHDKYLAQGWSSPLLQKENMLKCVLRKSKKPRKRPPKRIRFSKMNVEHIIPSRNELIEDEYIELEGTSDILTTVKQEVKMEQAAPRVEDETKRQNLRNSLRSEAERQIAALESEIEALELETHPDDIFDISSRVRELCAIVFPLNDDISVGAKIGLATPFDDEIFSILNDYKS